MGFNPSAPKCESSGGVVKSIQRGVGTLTSLVISPVNSERSILLIDGVTNISSGYAIHNGTGACVTSAYATVSGGGGAVLESLTDDAVTISNVKATYSWQLVEFY